MTIIRYLKLLLQEFLLNMIQLDPEKRLSAEDYLDWQRGNVFPEFFYGPIYEYMQTFTLPHWGSADSKIDKYLHPLFFFMPLTFVFMEQFGYSRLHRDLTDLIEYLSSDNGVIIIVNLVLSSLR